jgi:alkanesulfonate monooxygenase SsuD/methylene tetrahydromethanopterin reductase-like flavin-dependent oxidoreductase (luciferase family)
MESAATADILSGGRISLGLGMGYRPNEFDGMGFAKNTRGARLTEAMEVMRLGTGNDSFTYQGKHHQYENQQVFPRPLQKPIDMWLCGGTMPITAQRAGRSGFNYWIANSPYEACVDIVKTYKEEGRKAGYRDDQLRLAAFRDVFIGDSVKEAEEMRDYYLHAYYDEHIRAYGYLIDDDGQPLFWPDYDHPVYQRFVASLYCGTVEMVIEEIQRYRDLGIEALTVPPGQMEIFAKHIIPAFS